jgi:hypothetical protein
VSGNRHPVIHEDHRPRSSSPDSGPHSRNEACA